MQKQQDEESTVKKLECSKLWPSGHIDGTGIVGMMARELLELEERFEKLARWESFDRKSWISSLETAIHAWNEGSMPFLLEDANKDPSVNSGEHQSKTHHATTPSSFNSSGGGSQNSTMTSYQIVCMIRVSFTSQMLTSFFHCCDNIDILGLSCFKLCFFLLP